MSPPPDASASHHGEFCLVTDDSDIRTKPTWSERMLTMLGNGLDRYGLPTVFLLLVLFALYRGGVWTGEHVILPLVGGHVDFMAATKETQRQQAETQKKQLEQQEIHTEAIEKLTTAVEGFKSGQDESHVLQRRQIELLESINEKKSPM